MEYCICNFSMTSGKWIILVLLIIMVVFTEFYDCIHLECNGLVCGYGTKNDKCKSNKCMCKDNFDRKHIVTINGKKIQVCVKKCRDCHDGHEISFNDKTCSNGYLRTDLGQCINQMECNEHPSICRGNSTCVEYDWCECFSGYDDYTIGEVKNCTDIDECQENTNICGVNSSCINLLGTFNCSCNAGFETKRPGGGCTDTNECERKLDDCEQNTECVNLPGNFTCKCLHGYENVTGNTKTCTDIDECVKNDRICGGNSKCTNLPGNFTCECLDGYESSHMNSTDCFDIDECAKNSTNCDEHSVCVNKPGSYTCSCREGFRAVSDGNSTCIRDYAMEESALTQLNSSIGLYIGIPLATIVLIAILVVVVILRRRQLSKSSMEPTQSTELSSGIMAKNQVYENITPSVVLDHVDIHASSSQATGIKSGPDNKALAKSISRDSNGRSLGYANDKIAENKRKIREAKLKNASDGSQEPDIVYSAPYEEPGNVIYQNETVANGFNTKAATSNTYHVLYDVKPKLENNSVDKGQYVNVQTDDNQEYSLANSIDDYSHLKRQ